MPGMAKMDSTITLPPMRPGSDSPRIVTIGQQRVAERVLADDDALGQSLGPRRLDVVLPHHLQHALAHVAREPGQAAEGRDHDRQDQVAAKSDCCCQKDRYSQFSERSPEIGSQPS